MTADSSPLTPYYVAFQRVPGMGRHRFELLEAAFGSLSAAWSAPETGLIAAGLDAKTAAAVEQTRRSLSPGGEWERLQRLGVRAVTWHDAEYPRLLKECFDRPPVLYLRGAFAPEDEFSIAVVGTRAMTPYGRAVTEQLCEELAAAGVTVVSGLARGVDGAAHRAALRQGGRTVAVLPSPVTEVYPPVHRQLADQVAEHGAVVSEYYPGERLRRESFWRRNRIVAGLSLGIVVTEGDDASGALITARQALEENREVFAVPGSIFSPGSRGTNGLIQRGEAKLVVHAEDVLSELNLSSVPQQLALEQALPAEADESYVLQCLGSEPQHIDEVTRRTGFEPARVSALIAMLELRGAVRAVGPMSYARAR